MTPKELKKCKRESHRLQFDGKDYQQAAYDALGEIGATTEGGPDVSDDELCEIESAPDIYCDCGFCKSAKWPDVDL